MNSIAILALIANAEVTHNIPTGLLRSVCEVESSLNPYAVVVNDGKSGSTSFGVCQVQQKTAAQFYPGISASQLSEPGVNALAAGAYLAYNFRRYGSWGRAVVAYNKGSSSGGMNSYSRKVLSSYGRNKKYQRRAHSKNTRRGVDPQRSIRFLREDLSYSN